jgi:hypothetical protein
VILQKVGAFLGIVTSLIGIWQFVASETDLLGRGPVAIAKDIGSGSNEPTVPTLPPITTGDQLEAPTGVAISGDCDSGFTLTWQPVEGAERYRVERDGFFAGEESDTDHSIRPFPDGQQHRFRVFAEALQRPRSDPSDEVVTDACSFTQSS